MVAPAMRNEASQRRFPNTIVTAKLRTLMPHPTSILVDGIENGLHLGAQLFIAQRGATKIDFSCGQARPSTPMRTDSIVQWLSCGKPLTAICLAQLYEAGELLLEDRVTRFIPEFGTNGKEAVTLWHLL